MYGHSVAQPGGSETKPEYYMHQLGAYAMTHSKESFRDGATAYKNAMELTAEHRNAAIARANETAPTIEEDTEEGENSNGEDETQAEPSNIMHSFDCSTSQTFSTLAEDEEEDQDESETSIDELADYVPLPTKRPSSKLLPSHRQKRKTGQRSAKLTARSTGRRK